MHKQFQSVYIHWLPTWDVKYLPWIKRISHTLYQPETKPKWVLLPFANQFDFGKQSIYCRGQTRLDPASPICKHMFSAPRLKYNAPTFLPQKCQPRWCQPLDAWLSSTTQTMAIKTSCEVKAHYLKTNGGTENCLLVQNAKSNKKCM